MTYLKKVFISDCRNYKIEVEEYNIDLEDRKDTSYYYILYKNVDLYLKDRSFYDSCWDVLEKSSYFSSLDSCIENSFLSLYNNVEEGENLYGKISFLEYNKWKDNFWKLSWEHDEKNLNKYEASYNSINYCKNCNLYIYKNRNNKFKYKINPSFLNKIINSDEFDSKEEAYNHSIKTRNDVIYIFRFNDSIKTININQEFEIENSDYKNRIENVFCRKSSSYKELEDLLKIEFQEEINDIVWNEARKIVNDLHERGLCVSYNELCDDPDYASLDILVSMLLNNIVFFNKDKIVDMFLKFNSKKDLEV